MKRIYLIITPFFPSQESFRGPYIYDQVVAIQKEGNYDVVVLKPKQFYSNKKDYKYEGVNVFFFNVYDLPSAMFPGLFNILAISSLKRKLRSLNIDLTQIAVVHSHVTVAGIYAIYLKKRVSTIKTIVQHHGFDVLSLSNGIFSKFKWHRNWVKNYGIDICNQIDLHVGVSAKTLEFVSEIPEIIIKSQYALYNGVDESKFHPVIGIKDPNYFTIGCIANFWPLKDQLTLIKAVELLVNKGFQNLRITFIGSGSTLQSCKDYVKDNGLNNYIEFLAEINHVKLKNYYNKLDLFVLPSYYEAFGCVYTEAYACGVPFIAVKGQGIGELIPSEETNRWLIDKGDYKNLGSLIQKYMENRYIQNLSHSININFLIHKFLIHINEID
ncbi:glycosyltransferase family 4 protein [Flavobacterium xanthum]|uniref:Glycosyltransferase involved in cell wall bisynthesis n=1 Tax=Flavobacterium xanthum TaxID=69322 RepID=A0A1M6YBH3_9FLAO|nr:glycosyltransferase family 4 protein [Flavobacterium xanthum]SHL15492.1 Glycosyltransferase involved in cell wall bisynthesis [Flavobacterium xanthum]